MGQGVRRMLEEHGATLDGVAEDDAWVVEVCGLPLRVFGVDPSVDIKTSLDSIFVEAPDDSGPTASSAVSELNALLAERARPAGEALQLLLKLLGEAGNQKAGSSSVGTGRGPTGTTSQECEDDSDVDIEVECDARFSPRAEEVLDVADVDPLAQPRAHEASVRPAAGREEELETAMERLITVFMDAVESAQGPKLPGGRGAYAVLLRHCKWDDADALKKWQLDPAALAAQAGLRPPPPSRGSAASSSRPPTAWRCGICFDDFEANSGRGLDLGCQHMYCISCWRQHLAAMARGGGGGGIRVLDITCPEPACILVVSSGVYERLGLATLLQTYRRALLRSFIDEGGACVECPGCSRIVLLGSARPDAGPCRHCGRRFCAQCFSGPHGPLTCAEHRTWIKLLKESRQGSLSRWATRLRNFINLDSELTARRCPNPECGTMTQKVEGCLFLGCPRCREMWCWNCGAWGGGPSGRPQPHHVFVCTQMPADPTWLDGHASLVNDDARMDFYRQQWDERMKSLAALAPPPPPTLEPVSPSEGESSGFAAGSTGGSAGATLVAATAAVEAAAGVQFRAFPYTDRAPAPMAQAATVVESRASNAGDSVDRELAAAVHEARSVLLQGAAWCFFERGTEKKRLFEFAEADLERLLKQASQLERPQLCSSAHEREQRERRQRAMALAAALRSQAQALRSYRRVGGA